MSMQFRAIIAASALLLTPSIAQADEVTGRIGLFDAEQHTITLTNGMTFFVADISIAELSSGEYVKITFEMVNGMLVAVKLSRSDREA